MMTLENAARLKKDFSYLTGEDYQGKKIEELIVTPNDDPEFRQSTKNYRMNFDPNQVVPASKLDGYTVTAILQSNKNIRNSGALIHADLLNILLHKNIEIDYNKYHIKEQGQG